MSGNIYILANGGTPPSPWTRQTGYDGRYIRFGSTLGGTGGTSTHTHTYSGLTIGTSTYTYTFFGYSYPNSPAMDLHTHTCNGGITVSAVNNAPVYYTLELWYMDMATWESLERRFPAGAVFLAQGDIAWDEAPEFSTYYNKMVKLGTAGSTGGADTHTHALTGTLDSNNVGQYLQNNGYVPYQRVNTHSHTINLTTSSANSIPQHIYTKIYKTTSTTVKAQAGIVCFTDGTPSANWTVLTGWYGYFFRPGSGFGTSGSGTHSHSSVSGYSDGYTFAHYALSDASIDYTRNAVNDPHYHSVAFSLQNNVDHQPPYVDLKPMQLNNTLYHVNVYTLAETDTVRIKKVQTRSVTPDALVQKAQTLADPMKMLLQKFDIETPVDMDTSILVQYDLDLDDVTARLKKPTDIGLSASVIVAILSNAWEMTMRLVRYWNPVGKPILDSIMKGWIDEIQTVDNKIQVMYLNSSLDYAIGSELDTKWGEVYELPRLASESDDEYRKRIKTYVTMQTGSGTKATIETVLDTIIEEVGASRVETYTPGRVKIFFDTGTALHHAAVHKDLIDYVLPQALSVGVYYELYLTFVDYLLDVYLQGSKDVAYDMDHLEAYVDLERELYMYVTALNQVEATYDMDSSAMTILEKVLYVLTRVLLSNDQTYIMDLRSNIALEKLYDLTVRVLHENFLALYDSTVGILKDNYKDLFVTVAALKTRDSTYIASVTLI